MGAHTDIEKHQLGWVYRRGSARDLANVMRKLIQNRNELERINISLISNKSPSPQMQASRLFEIINRRFGAL
jgi:hypothetical protein